MSRRYIFSSESVGEGHPDKVCDAISDAVLDACIEQDRHSRVACETYAKSNIVIVGGEITIPSLSEEKPLESVIPFRQIVRETVREIGYVNDDDVFHADKIFDPPISLRSSLLTLHKAWMHAQPRERKPQNKGPAIKASCSVTPVTKRRSSCHPQSCMPIDLVANSRASARSGKVGWLRPDAKSQVSVIYENGKPIGISCVVVSTQHTRDVKHSEIRSFVIEEVIKKVLPKEMLTEKTQFLVNPTGNFVVGGPQGDTGLTGRKIIVDSYGGMGRHGGGAFSGKDPSKVDRSAAYMATLGGKERRCRRSRRRNAKSNSPTPSAIPSH